MNDNDPVFPNPLLRLVVSESTEPGSLFPLPLAVDVDSPSNGVVEYQLLDARDAPFRLVVRNATAAASATSAAAIAVPEVRLSLRRALDRETKDAYQLMVVAYDGGAPSRRSATLAVDVVVGDLNDNSPEFDKPIYEAQVPENTPIGKVRFKVI